MSAQAGIAFILTNDAMPGFSRFEFTLKDDIATRIRKINKTDVPIPYRVHFAAAVNDCELLDRTLHYLFSEHCEARDSRFFALYPDRLRAVVELAATSVIEVSDEEIGIAADMLVRMERLKAAQHVPGTNPSNAEPGTLLYFSKDAAITGIARANGMIEIEGETMPAANATLRALRSIGFDWEEASAADYWLPDPIGQIGGSATAHDNAVVDGDFQKAPMPRKNVGSESPVVFIRNEKI